MSVARPRRRVPQVNLFVPPTRGFTLRMPAGWAQIGAIGCVMLVWGLIAFGLGLLMGWHPH